MSTDSSSDHSKKRRLLRFLKRLACVSIALLVIGFTWEYLASREIRRAYPAPGQLVDLNGRHLHLQVFGEGGPIVVFESGLGRSGLAWHEVASRTSEFARVVTYDRAGLGWSDPSTHPCDANHVVEDLRSLLDAAEIEGPFILVGHSVGGLYARLFSYRFPKSTLGIVLVESSHERQLERMPAEVRDRIKGGNPLISVMKHGAKFGLLRLYMRFQKEDALGGMPRRIPSEHRQAWIELMSCQSTIETIEKELAAVPDSMRQTAQEFLPWGDMPLRVITAGDPGFPIKDRKLAEETRKTWNDLQDDLVSRSTRSAQIVVQEGGHALHETHPDVVVQAIREIINLTTDSPSSPSEGR